MIRINLLPLVERPSKWPINRLLVVAGCLLSMFFSAFYSYTVFELWNMEKELQNTRNQYQLLQPTQVLMTTATNKQQLFNNKNNILVGLTKERLPLYGMVQHLTAVTSPQVWFTDIVKSDKGLIQIKGWSTTYPLVAEFMQTMENDQFFMEPVLTNVEKDTMTQATKFEIVVKARGI